MITPIIEKLLLQGKGDFRTFTIFAAQAAKLSVPDGSFIVITDIKVSPGGNLTAPNDEGGILNSVDRYSIMQLDLFSKSIKRNSFLIKNPYVLGYNDNDNTRYVRNGEPQHFDVLMVADNDVYFSILRFQGVAELGAITTGNLNSTQLPAEPVSYGTTLPVIQRMQLEDGMKYNPVGFEEYLPVTKPGQQYARNAISASGSNSPMPIIAINQDRNFNRHVINVSYVQFSQQVKQNFV